MYNNVRWFSRNTFLKRFILLIDDKKKFNQKRLPAIYYFS